MTEPTAADHPFREVRARYDDRTIIVYQAFSDAIAAPAVAAKTFVPPFSRSRMTWIKPSFRWMMYRSGWATKPGQERVLSIRIRRDGFEEILARSCLSSYEKNLYGGEAAWKSALDSAEGRIQWDPERTEEMAALGHRTIQIGIRGSLIDGYLDRWIDDIVDLTPEVQRLREKRGAGSAELAAMYSQERPYPLSEDLRQTIGATG